MNHRRRFPRTPSDAHLTTPPDTRPFTCERRHEEDVSCTSFAQMLAAEFGFKDCPPIPFAETSRHLLQNGHATRIDTFEEEGGFVKRLRITRRPKISPKLLANLPPRLRQALPRQPSQSGQ